MTMVFDALKLALSSIWQHKIRALLTVLGIVIGVSSVVMFMAVGEGLQRDVNNEITTLGTNLVTVIPGQFDPESGAISTSIVSGDILKPVDVERLDALEGVRAVSPYMLVGGVLRRDRTTAPQAMILGSNAAITTTMSSIEVEKGRMFTEAENAEQARLIVLGPAIAKTLFDSESAVGQTVQIGKEDFEIVGVTKVPDSASIIGGSDYANMAIIPIQTAGEIAGGAKIMRLVLTLEESIDAKAYVPTLEAELLKEHAPEDFTVMTQDELLGTVNDVLSMLTAAVSAIAAISLLVAGVGIMNIMLVSVTERTKEIGLRKAVGATTAAILWQFLIEAIVLSVFGALLATGLAWGAAQLAAEYSPLTPIITMDAVGLAVGVGIAVGLIFGIAPAYRAARMDPIQALRYE